MTENVTPRMAGQLARFDVLRATVNGAEDRDAAVDQAAATAVERLLAEHGTAALVGLVAELTFEALLSYQHQAVALRDRNLEPVAEMLERLWSEASDESVRADIDRWEQFERRVFLREPEHDARTGALTAA